MCDSAQDLSKRGRKATSDNKSVSRLNTANLLAQNTIYCLRKNLRIFFQKVPLRISPTNQNLKSFSASFFKDFAFSIYKEGKFGYNSSNNFTIKRK